MQVKTETGRIKDVGILEVTPENFICPSNERNMYHCRIEIKKFNPETGERLSKPRIQVFGKKFFETFGLHNLRKQGLPPKNEPKQKPKKRPKGKRLERKYWKN